MSARAPERAAARAAETVDESYTHGPLLVEGPNERTVAAVRETGARTYMEIGVYLGATASAVAEVLDGQGEIHLLDFEDRVTPVASRLRAAGHGNVVAHANSRRALDSYNWSLMKLLRDGRAGTFDYVFLDGAHTWAHDALAFLLVDRLLEPGGHVDFDDYGWTLARSPSMRPDAFAPTRQLYSDEQIETQQVALVVDLLVRSDPRYEEVVENKVFRKRADAPGPATSLASAIPPGPATSRASAIPPGPATSLASAIPLGPETSRP
jgi:predicted O-methyltransferase YrrM